MSLFDRRQARAARTARRAELDGSGPTREDWRPAAWPGAHSGFAMWGEVMLTGVLMSLVSIAVVTAPAALAAGVRHLARYLRGEASPWHEFWREVRAAMPGGLGIGVAATVLAAVLAVDIYLAGTGLLPGATLIAIVGWAGLLALGTSLLAAVGQWDADAGWRAAVMRGLSQLRGDMGGAAYLVATVAFVGVTTWALPILVIPALGCAALAVVAIPARPRRTAASQD